MTVRELTTHIAELPFWIMMALTTDGLDFTTNSYSSRNIGNATELLDLFEHSLADGESSLSQVTDEQLEPMWTLSNGDEIYSRTTKGEVIRMTFSQIVHHRAQLGVFLRLLNIPIPGSYGPSADAMTFLSVTRLMLHFLVKNTVRLVKLLHGIAFFCHYDAGAIFG